MDIDLDGLFLALLAMVTLIVMVVVAGTVAHGLGYLPADGSHRGD